MSLNILHTGIFLMINYGSLWNQVLAKSKILTCMHITDNLRFSSNLKFAAHRSWTKYCPMSVLILWDN